MCARRLFLFFLLLLGDFFLRFGLFTRLLALVLGFDHVLFFKLTRIGGAELFVHAFAARKIGIDLGGGRIRTDQLAALVGANAHHIGDFACAVAF